MNLSKVYIRTGLGNALLDVPYGNISGDARRLMALIDGNSSVGDIAGKVPLSVQRQLEAIFAQLLSKHLIAEKAGSGSAWGGPGSAAGEGSGEDLQAGTQGNENSPVPSDFEKENKRRVELEHELVEVYSQLADTKARQKEVEAVCRRLEQQVAAFEQSRQLEVAESMQKPPVKAGTVVELHDSLDNLNQLNQALLEQQEILDKTLKLRSFQVELADEQPQLNRDAVDEKVAQSDPNYKKLRGLEFFKSFANAELLHFLTFAKWLKVEAGDTIFNEGEVGLPFYIIVSGTIKVIRREKELATLGWGNFFGEFAYLSEGEPRRSAQAVAATDCELLMVEPMEVEFSSVQMRLHVVEALLRGQVKRELLSSQRIDNLMSHLEIPEAHDPL